MASITNIPVWQLPNKMGSSNVSIATSLMSLDPYVFSHPSRKFFGATVCSRPPTSLIAIPLQNLLAKLHMKYYLLHCQISTGFAHLAAFALLPPPIWIITSFILEHAAASSLVIHQIKKHIASSTSTLTPYSLAVMFVSMKTFSLFLSFPPPPIPCLYLNLC